MSAAASLDWTTDEEDVDDRLACHPAPCGTPFRLFPELEEEDSRARTALDAYADHFRLDRRPLRRVYET